MNAVAERLGQVNATNRAIAEVIKAGELFALEIQAEIAQEDARPQAKQDAILRLMATNNPLTSTGDKPKLHSASSAEAVVETDPDYALFRAKQRQQVVNKIRAHAQYKAAELRAKMELALLATAQ